MSFQLKWDPVRANISPELTRRQSYGGAVQQVSDTLNTLANQTRKENTQEHLNTIAGMQNLMALNNNQDAIMNTVGNYGDNTVDREAILNAFNTKNKELSAKLGTDTANNLYLNGATNEDIIHAASQLNPESQGPLVDLLRSNTELQYKKDMDATKNRQEDTRLGISATQTSYQGIQAMSNLAKLIQEHPGLTTREEYIQDGEQRVRTTINPGLAEILEASGLGGKIAQLIGPGGLGGSNPNTPSTGQVGQVHVGNSYGTGSAKVTIGAHHNEVIGAARTFGLSDVVTAGLLGNLEAEGGYTGDAGDGGNSQGIIQWNGPRLENYKRVMGKSPGESTVTEQMMFFKWEMENLDKSGALVYNKKDNLTPKQQYDLIMNANSPEQAAEYIDKYYERSSGVHRKKRIDYATSFYEGLTGGVASNIGNGTGAVTPVYTNNTVEAGSGKGAINSALGSGVTPQVTDAKVDGKSYKISHALIGATQAAVGGYEAQQEKNRNYKLNSKNHATRTIEFNAFKDKEGFSAGGDHEDLLKYVNNVPEYMALSSDDKQVALKQLKADKSAKGYDSARSAMTKIVTNMRSSEVSKARTGAIDQFVKESEKLYNEVKKDNPTITLDEVMQMVNMEKYNQWQTRTSPPKAPPKAKATATPKGKGVPYKQAAPTSNVGKEAAARLGIDPRFKNPYG